MVWHLIDDPVLDLRRLHDDRLLLYFLVVIDKAIVVDALQLWHILCSIKFVRVDEVEFSWDTPICADFL